ncbi:MAG: NADPH-dependent assimilatory sulfite reductase hemoprotein subunit [Alphaproteobacteria bacterium]|nr:NADPH-dependent assimilatory sulfite reductase hemoprotein subunit [Alphaproteobacteria bacterium]
MTEKKLVGQEKIKEESTFLRGNIAAELADSTTLDVSDATYELLKFHGSYYGYDRDTATARKKQGLDKEHEFMLRLKMPAGRLTAAQYLALDALSDKFANGTLRVTTRETFQFHCILKYNLKKFIAEVNRHLLSTLGGCGDVVRNITACPAPIKDKIHARLDADTKAIALAVAPRTTAYYEIWLDGEKIEDYPFAQLPEPADNPEPLYGTTYLPRKFKIGIAQPEDNSIDVLTNDIAILALFEGQELVGYNFALGGGLGVQHNNPKTSPRLATPIAFVEPADLIPTVEAVVKLQRDHGDRTDRRRARLKYVVEEKGLVWTKRTMEEYLGKTLEDPRPMPSFKIVNHMGWHEQGDGKWYLGVPISSGRILDRGDEKIRTGLRDVISHYQMPLVLTADQNIILYDIEASQKADIVARLKAHGIKLKEDITPLYRYFLACVALPTCGKALAEAERVKLPLVAELEAALARHGLSQQDIYISMSGCPNGCSRPYTGEIGIVGRIPDHYAIFIGGNFECTRLNTKIFDKVPLAQIAPLCDAMFGLYKAHRHAGEGFGDFCVRHGVDTVREVADAALGGKVK